MISAQSWSVSEIIEIDLLVFEILRLLQDNLSLLVSEILLFLQVHFNLLFSEMFMIYQNNSIYSEFEFN